MKNHNKLLLFVCLVLSACAEEKIRDSAPTERQARKLDVDAIPDAVPRAEPKSRYGNPASYVVFGERYYVMDSSSGFVEKGIASWYGKKFHGRRTSSGETYDMYAMTAAHKSLPLPTYVEVSNLRNNRRIIVRVNDRGPFHDNRIIDLSYTAARKLDIVKNGTGLVEIRAIDPKNFGKKQIAGMPVPGEPPGAPVRSAQLADTVDGFYIQVGAFSNEVNAQRMHDRITSLAEDLVKIRPAHVRGKPVYRVQIGPLYDIDQSDELVMKLENTGITEHHIVVDR